MKKLLIAATVVSLTALPGSAQASNWSTGLGHCNTTIPFPSLAGRWFGYILFRPCVGA